MVQINLLGDRAKGKRRGFNLPPLGEALGQFKGLIHFATILSVMGIIVPFVGVKQLINDENRRLQDTLFKQQSKIQELVQQEKDLESDISQIDGLTKQIESLRLKVAAVERLVSTRLYPVPVLDSISQVMPKLVWLTEVNYNTNGQTGEVVASGKATTNDVLSDFLAALQEVPRFTKVSLDESIHESDKELDYKRFKLHLLTKEGGP